MRGKIYLEKLYRRVAAIICLTREKVNADLGSVMFEPDGVNEKLSWSF